MIKSHPIKVKALKILKAQSVNSETKVKVQKTISIQS